MGGIRGRTVRNGGFPARRNRYVPLRRLGADNAGMDADPLRTGWPMWSPPPGLPGLLRAPATPAGALEALLRAAARRLGGRRFTVPGTDLALRVEALELRPDPVGLAFGQLDDVRLVARDLEWRGIACERLVAVWRNVHVRPLPEAAVVSAPVEVELALRPAVVAERLASARPALRLDVAAGDDGPDLSGTGSPAEVRLRWAARPRWGALVVQPEVATGEGPGGGVLHLRPVALRLRAHRLALPGWLPPARLRLPTLPRGLRVRSVVVDAQVVVVRLVADEWREALPGSRLTEAARWLSRLA